MYNPSFKLTSTGFTTTTILSILFCDVSSLVLDELSPQNYSTFHYSEYRTIQHKLGEKLGANTVITTRPSPVNIHGTHKM
jgi:hypothetical protein